MIKRILAAAALALVLQPAAADTDPSQSDMRINPQLEITENSMDYSGYSFLNIKADTIEMNGADWSAIKERFAAAAAGDTCFSIVYLGDSHIQADFGGSVFRKRIAETAGSAGRGIIIPFRLAGTNQPNDYTISSGDPVVSSRLLKQPWATEMPFTGIGIQPTGGEMTAHITCDETFDRIRLLWRGQEPTITAVYGSSVDDAVEFRQTSASEIVLDMPATDIHLRIASPADMVLAGMILSNGNTGTFVHSIGNNGATYSTYNQISSFGDELSALSPDLVIIALGTNEAFGRFTAESLANDIDLLVNSIRSHNPDAGIILVTPTECYKKTYRRRRRRRRSTGLTVNTKVAVARDIIASYAREHNIPLFDSYEIAGGAGSASRMKRASLLGRDGVHFTSGGYRLQGSLLSDAVIRELTRQPSQPEETHSSND